MVSVVVVLVVVVMVVVVLVVVVMAYGVQADVLPARLEVGVHDEACQASFG